MAVKLPLSLQVLGTRFGVLFSPLLRVPATVSQAVTYIDGFKVAKYSSISELTAATSKLRWTKDPWNGKLDIIKHPTFMQQAIEQHPDFSGDCDDFAAYDCVALAKNKLADEQWFASALWVDAKSNTITGHAICVYRVGTEWFHIGNWNKCVPMPLQSKTSWMQEIELLRDVNVITAVMYQAFATKDDSLALGKVKVVRN